MGAAPPPSPQEIFRKLSIKPGKGKKIDKSPSLVPASPTHALTKNHSHSPTESDSEHVLLSSAPHSLASGGALLSGTSASTAAGPARDPAMGPESAHPQPLSSIAERTGDGDEESDEDDDEDHPPRTGDKSHNLDAFDGACTIKSGYLDKRGERRNIWKPRWIVLRPKHLAYYKTSDEYKPLRLLDLADVRACTPTTLKKAPYTFAVVCNARTFYLRAASEEEVKAWTVAILDARDAQAENASGTDGRPPPHGHGHAHSREGFAVGSPSAPIPVPATTRSRVGSITLTPPFYGMPTQMTTTSESEEGSPSAQRVLSSSPHQPGNVVHGPSTVHEHARTPGRGMSSSPPGRGLVQGGGRDGVSTNVVFSGYLLKCGSKRYKWHKRWFTLYNDKLAYSTSHMSTKPNRQFSVSEILDAFEFDMRTHKHSVGGPPPATTEHTFKIVATTRTLVVCAPSEEEEIQWLSAIRALIARRTGVEGGSRHKGRGLSVSGPGGE